MTSMIYSFRLTVHCLEIAKGYDGLLRGKPEPLLILAAYTLNDIAIRTLGRTLHTFLPKDPFPSTAQPKQHSVIDMEVVAKRPMYFAVLGIALEEDRGKDVQSLYGLLEEHHNLSVWSPTSSNPVPLTLEELRGSGNEWRYPREANLLIEGSEASSNCRSDKWIGAVAWCFPASVNLDGARYRLHFLSQDGRNDWTAIVDLWISSTLR